ncbi:MAG: diguanylate cyclase/phosphodiesterase with sensor(s) [Burkholderiaceae bacterium]|nr:diguanylate cyclase/phosphodiesterase with sensor(s) [Burkholderiaceae bacterium]
MIPRHARVLFYGSCVLVAVLLLGSIVLAQQGGLLLLDNLHWTISFTAAAILGWIGAGATKQRDQRTRYWFALGLSAACLGQWMWNFEALLGWLSLPDPYHYLSQLPGLGQFIESEQAFPLSAFASVLLGAGFIAGLYTALRGQLETRQMRPAMLDLASMVLLLLSLIFAIYLPRSSEVTGLTLLLLTAFPLFLLSATCLGALTVLHLRMRPDWPWICTLAGLATLGALWMQWNTLTLDDALTNGGLVNALFSPAMLLLAFGAMSWRTRPDRSPRFDRLCEGTLRMLPLFIVMLAALSILVVLLTPNTQPAVRYAVLAAGMLNLSLSVLRQRLLLTEYRQLQDSERLVADSQARYEYLAKHDALTKLPNRFSLMEKLGAMMAKARLERRPLALFLLDIDYFKNVNDCYGHTVGDALLLSIVERLLKHKRESDVLARLGSDEFALLTFDAYDRESLITYAHYLLDTLCTPFQLSNGAEVYSSATIGISLFPDDAIDPVQMMRNADTAMYEAKKRGRTLFHFYTADLTAAAQQRLEIGGQLRRALDADEFLLHYQPQVNQNGLVFGVEALLRWQRADGKMIPPDRFIPFAEENGLIIPIGDWVIDTACQQARAWKDAGLPDMQIAVNVSARQLRPELVDTIAASLARSGLAPTNLTIEVTESAIMERESLAISILNSLKDMGVKISIDDFGTGHSSLGKLKLLPLDELKIDKVFLHNLPQDSENAKIVSTIIAMAHSLKLDVLAEGVEDLAQAVFLEAHGCTQYQGYYFHRPMVPENVTALFNSKSGSLENSPGASQPRLFKSARTAVAG